MSLKIIAPVELVEDPRGVREALYQHFNIDTLELILFTCEHWHELTEGDVMEQHDRVLYALERHYRFHHIRLPFRQVFDAAAMLLDAMHQVRDSWVPLITPVTERLLYPTKLDLHRFTGNPLAALIELRPILHET